MTSRRAPILVSPEAAEVLSRDVVGLPVEGQQRLMFERNRVLTVLDAECGSLVRLAVGAVAWLLALAGGAGLCAALWHGAAPPLRLLGLVAGALLLLGATVLGARVWRAGRAVVDAFCWWTLLPLRVPDGSGADWGVSRAYDVVMARVFLFDGRRLPRVVVSALAFLAPFVFLLLATGSGGGPDSQATAMWPAGQEAALGVATLVVFVSCWAVGAVVGGGQYRANLAHSRRDPVQAAVLGAFRRR